MLIQGKEKGKKHTHGKENPENTIPGWPNTTTEVADENYQNIRNSYGVRSKRQDLDKRAGENACGIGSGDDACSVGSGCDVSGISADVKEEPGKSR